MTLVALRIVNDVSYLRRIYHESHSVWQAQFGEAQVPLFVAGAVLGEVRVPLLVAGTVLGEVQVPLFVAGAVLGEIRKDSPRAKCCIFQYKALVLSAKSNVGCAAGCGLMGSWSDRPRTVNDVSDVFTQILGGHFAWQAQY